MPSILVVTGSVRPNSVNKKVVPLAVEALEKQGVDVTIADLGELQLPFFDAPLSPSAPDFEPVHESVKQWTSLVEKADGVLFVTPEYNHTMSPVQMNAIDWIGREWEGKKVALVGYGWTSGAGQAHAAAREALAVVLKAKVGDYQTNLFFGQQLSPVGEVLDQAAIDEKLTATVSELLA